MVDEHDFLHSGLMVSVYCALCVVAIAMLLMILTLGDAFIAIL